MINIIKQNTLIKSFNSKHSKKISNETKIIKKNGYVCDICNKYFCRSDSLTRHKEKYCRTKNYTTIINNINNTTNIQNNIIINNFYCNMKFIKDDEILECINRCYSCIQELFKLIHIDTPENRNLYLSNMKDSFLYLYKNNKWELNDLIKYYNILKMIKKTLWKNIF